MWIEYNPNPVGRYVGDCAVRAISLALNMPWDDAHELNLTVLHGRCHGLVMSHDAKAAVNTGEGQIDALSLVKDAVTGCDF